MHIGELIKQRVKDCKMSIDDFAQAINISRSGVYYIFESDDILLSKLNIISRVLDFDFVSLMNGFSSHVITALIETDSRTFVKMRQNKAIKIHKIYSDSNNTYKHVQKNR